MLPSSCRCFCMGLAALSICTTAQHASGMAASSMASQPPALQGTGMQRFLAVPLPGAKSHYLQMAAIVKELASRGHHVKVRDLSVPAASCLLPDSGQPSAYLRDRAAPACSH